MIKGIKYMLAVGTLFFGLVASAQQPPRFDAKKASGLVTYDVDKVIKKLKLEDAATIKTAKTALATYNMQIYRLSDTYATPLQELNELFDRQVQVAMQRRDRSQMDGVKAKIREIIPPIRQEVSQYEEELNTAMASALDPKQNNKWLKYQKNQQPPSPAMLGG